MIEIEQDDWDHLELIARGAVVSAGVAAMGYYRGALAANTILENNLSPVTLADTQATRDILLNLSSRIPEIAGKLNLGMSFFAEELEKKHPSSPNDSRETHIQKIIDSAGLISPYIKRTTEEFQESFANCISILFDALDGTTNFRAGIPFFSSAIAFFIHGKPCVGAIYDPLHNLVYYGSLRLDRDGNTDSCTAYAWQVQSGNLIDLKCVNRTCTPNNLIATHLTRSHLAKRSDMIKKLEKLTENSEGTYMFNAGQLALAYIASGHLTAFINNHTNIWDVAAGDVIVSATGGKVTDFSGNPINYGKNAKIDVVASSDYEIFEKILSIIN